MNIGSALGQNMSGKLKADQIRVTGTTAYVSVAPDGVAGRIQSSFLGKPPREEMGVVPLGIQHVLTEGWEAMKFGLKKTDRI